MILLMMIALVVNEGSKTEQTGDWRQYSDTIQEIYRGFSGSETWEEQREIFDSLNANFNNLAFALAKNVAEEKLDPEKAASALYGAYFVQASIYNSSSQYDASLVMLDKALQLTKGTETEINVLRQKYQTAKGKGDLDIQIDSLEKIAYHPLYLTLPINLKRDYHTIHAKLAIAYEGKGETDMAISAYNDYFTIKREIQGTVREWDLEQWANFQKLADNTDHVITDSELLTYCSSMESNLNKTYPLPSDTQERFTQLNTDDSEIMGQNYETLRLHGPDAL